MTREICTVLDPEALLHHAARCKVLIHNAKKCSKEDKSSGVVGCWRTSRHSRENDSIFVVHSYECGVGVD